MFIKAVLESIITYYMQCAYIPIKICNKLDVISRGFFIGSTIERKEMHLMCLGLGYKTYYRGGWVFTMLALKT